MKNEEIAAAVLDAVGKTENVNSVIHCMTRLRFQLKDETKADDQVVKEIDGVLGVVHSNGQYQVIIGPNVGKVYEALCRIGGFKSKEPIDENLDKDIAKNKTRLSAKQVGKNILNYMSNCMTPLIPLLITSGLFKAVNAVFGPSMFHLYTEKDSMYLLFDFVFNAGFYFIPIYVGITAARQLKVDEMLGGLLGGILIVPELIDIVTKGKPFVIFGIPMTLVNYSQTVIPIMISVYFLSLVYHRIKKIMPDFITVLATPFLSMLITVPISLFLLAPLGSIIGQYISSGILAFSDATGFVGVAVIAMLWPFLVMTGMHLALMMPMLASYFETGYMTGAANGGMFATYAAYGVALGAFLRLSQPKVKSASLGYFLSGILGGITEPTLYGICFKYRRTFVTMMFGAALGGSYAGITHVSTYVMGGANFLAFLNFTGGTSANLINGSISLILTFIGAAIATYFFGFTKEEIAV
ncbi:PTS transporter subunit EIIC [Enterococcus cecorum]|uniref:PTS transporter subunit EIIC n=1 Tax=Enterococcus cecorum TaxID=44008 RepID=UPI0006439FD3|nr:PTS transporter subunit EIIC [Enterococcus cecorum]KLO69937.1 PTS fructose transporter subunit IIB [Enterococcus cecorum]CAI3491486.1 PTS transporter subunit EIIC [Enterococcus cecorum]